MQKKLQAILVLVGLILISCCAFLFLGPSQPVSVTYEADELVFCPWFDDERSALRDNLLSTASWPPKTEPGKTSNFALGDDRRLEELKTRLQQAELLELQHHHKLLASSAPLPSPSDDEEASSNSTGQPLLVFYVVGDWGTPRPALEAVAAAMNRHATEKNGHLRPQFIVSAGDHVYSGHGSVKNLLAVWQDYFLRYASLQVPWYPVLGNHDLDGPHSDAKQINLTFSDRNPHGLWRLIANHYRLSFGWLLEDSKNLVVRLDQTTDVSSPSPSSIPAWLDIFFFDTNGAQTELLHKRPELLSDFLQQRAWLDAATAASAAKWKLSVSHHSLFSLGTHRKVARQLRDCFGIEDLLVERGVAAHFSGHTHLNQHFYNRDLHHFVCGNSGARKTHSFQNPEFPQPILKPVWVDKATGFACVSVFAQRLVVDLIGSNNSVLHSTTILPPGN